jgi:UDP-hydrolysing UDP-N-acetyl-D-glucosamine 2-epimerase
MSLPRRIFFLSAARSDYDLISPVIRELVRRGGAPSIVAAAAQVSPFHGMGVEQIRADGVAIVGCVESLLCSETWAARSLSFAQLTDGLTRLLEVNRPDILLIAGDREEHLAGAIVGNFLGLHVAHLHGGDRCIASDIDEVFRPAISKLAHLHFPATENHRDRLIRMGENPECVWACGAPGIDRLRTEPDVPAETLRDELSLEIDQPFFLVIQHPSPMLDLDGTEAEMTELLEGVLSLGHPVLCSYPNIDPGNFGIRKAIDRAKAQHKNLRAYHNLPRDRFVSLYRRCAAIIGNSSSLVLESGFLKVPAILVGPRQDLRDRGDNVIRVDFDAAEIAAACRRALEDESFLATVAQGTSPYGDGQAAERIAQVLTTVELRREQLLKTMPY